MLEHLINDFFDQNPSSGGDPEVQNGNINMLKGREPHGRTRPIIVFKVEPLNKLDATLNKFIKSFTFKHVI